MENISDLKRYSAKVNSTAITRPESSQSSDLEAKITAMMASLGAMSPGRNESLPSEPPARLPRKRPLRHPWQVKWLDLEQTCHDVQKLADEAMAFAFEWFESRPSKFRVVVGGVGVGKTTVSKRIAYWAKLVAYHRWARDRRSGQLPEVLFQNATILSHELVKDLEFEEILGDIRSKSMVVIDDIGTEICRYKCATPALRLCRILNALEGRHLWITTNQRPDSWAAKWDKRVEDRLLAGEVVTVNAASYRSERA